VGLGSVVFVRHPLLCGDFGSVNKLNHGHTACA
jgi:hypothetical protein